jgi:hypothetical protein
MPTHRPHAGRLLFPIHHGTPGTDTAWKRDNALVISDDHGKSWHSALLPIATNPTPPPANQYCDVKDSGKSWPGSLFWRSTVIRGGAIGVHACCHSRGVLLGEAWTYVRYDSMPVGVGLKLGHTCDTIACMSGLG